MCVVKSVYIDYTLFSGERERVKREGERERREGEREREERGRERGRKKERESGLRDVI